MDAVAMTAKISDATAMATISSTKVMPRRALERAGRGGVAGAHGFRPEVSALGSRFSLGDVRDEGFRFIGKRG